MLENFILDFKFTKLILEKNIKILLKTLTYIKLEIIKEEIKDVKINKILIICHNSGFWLQISNGWMPYVIITSEDKNKG